MDTSAFRGEKEVNVRVIPNWIWTEWVQVYKSGAQRGVPYVGTFIKNS